MAEKVKKSMNAKGLKGIFKGSQYKKEAIISYGILIVGYALLQLGATAGLIGRNLQGQFVPICVYMSLAIALNLVVGLSGELSLGHAGFMAVGVFTGILVTRILEESISAGWLRLIIALVAAAFVASIAGFIIGIPILGLQGDYLAIVTLAFGEIVRNLMNVLYFGLDTEGKLRFAFNHTIDGVETSGRIITGAIGATGVDKTASFTSAALLTAFTLFVVLNLKNSKQGRAIMSIRDNRIAGESIGLNVRKYKLMAFTVSAALAGVGGVLYAHSLATLKEKTKNFGFNMSIMILVYVVLGGIENIRGSVIAPVLLNLILDYVLRKLQMLGSNPVLQFMSDNRMLIYAIVLIVIMIFTWSPKMIAWRESVFKGRRGKEADPS